MILNYQSFNLSPISYKFIFINLITYNYYLFILENYKYCFIYFLSIIKV